MPTEFGQNEINRYLVTEQFYGIGKANLRKLRNSRVVIIGCGGLGSAVASLLTRTGVGFIRLVDRCILELDDLHSHILYKEHDVKKGLPKAIAAAESLFLINSTISFEPTVTDINRLNVQEIISDVDLVIDAVDNTESHFLINEACVKLGKPLIFGATAQSAGITMTIIPQKTSCLKCVYDNIALVSSFLQNEKTVSLGSTVLLTAATQATEAIKILINDKRQLNKNLIHIDLWQNHYQLIDVTKSKIQKNCPVCNNHQFDLLTGKRGTIYIKPIGSNQIQIIPFTATKIDLPQLAIHLSSTRMVTANDYHVRFEIDQYQITVFADGRAIIKGTTDNEIARNLYRKFIT